jgi:hypothetical protein
VFDKILKKQETPFIQEFNSYLHSKRVVFFAHALPVGGRHECVVLRERHVTAGGATVPLKGKGRKTNKEKKKTQGPQKNQKSKNHKIGTKKEKEQFICSLLLLLLLLLFLRRCPTYVACPSSAETLRLLPVVGRPPPQWSQRWVPKEMLIKGKSLSLKISNIEKKG